MRNVYVKRMEIFQYFQVILRLFNRIRYNELRIFIAVYYKVFINVYNLAY